MDRKRLLDPSFVKEIMAATPIQWPFSIGTNLTMRGIKKMNITQLFLLQKNLDERIIKDKGLQGENLLPNKSLALKVELGELANEWRGFKHWSTDKAPRREKMLVEYVDCLHFILSIGWEIDETDYSYNVNVSYLDDITHAFSYLISNNWMVGTGYQVGFDYFIKLGDMLGFTWEEIEQAYLDKNAVNHDRQASGY